MYESSQFVCFVMSVAVVDILITCVFIAAITRERSEDSPKLDSTCIVGRTESHEQLFFECNLGTADERDYGGRWNQLLC
jgi:hypothetical protein